MAKKENLNDHRAEFRVASGSWIPLCVVEELDSQIETSEPAIITFGGFSLCREHFEKVTNLIKDGISMGAVVNAMMTTGLDGDAPYK